MSATIRSRAKIFRSRADGTARGLDQTFFQNLFDFIPNNNFTTILTFLRILFFKFPYFVSKHEIIEI